jgi:hypothetical protein
MGRKMLALTGISTAALLGAVGLGISAVPVSSALPNVNVTVDLQPYLPDVPISGLEVLLYPAGPCAVGASTCNSVLGLANLSLFVLPPGA